MLIAVPGRGVIGDRLSRHPDVAKIMFTGSTETAKSIVEAASDTMKRMTLELGGDDAGIGLEEQNPFGPLQNREQREVVDRLARAATDSGARVLLGAYRCRPGRSNLEQAFVWANALDEALGSWLWSADIERAVEVAARLAAGTTWINKHGAVDPKIPFGGARESGFSMEFGVVGLCAQCSS